MARLIKRYPEIGCFLWRNEHLTLPNDKRNIIDTQVRPMIISNTSVALNCPDCGMDIPSDMLDYYWDDCPPCLEWK